MSKLRRNIDMMYKRRLCVEILNCKKSILLIGPRQTGKSTLIRSLDPELIINFADEKTFLQFSAQPDLLINILQFKKPKTIFIDEVQRLPSILNTIQALLDENINKFKFYLTGSSARKLRRGNANLLPGRIVSFQMTPLSIEELEFEFDLKKILSLGLLPGILIEKDLKTRKQVLTTYSGSYLKEEIQAEALTKNIEGFSRFLFVAASRNSQFVDFAKMGSQAGVTQKTATRFFEILEDTLIVTRLNAFAKTEYRRIIQHPKFYFFDTGVLNGLLGNYQVSEDRIGELFETFIFNQIQSFCFSRSLDIRLSTYRTEAGAEIDIIMQYEDYLLAIEIKASKNIGRSDLKGFASFSEVYSKSFAKLVIYLGSHSQKIDNVEVHPVVEGLQYIIRWVEKNSK
jgi:predicted AAA+ superfamily ATPase